MNMNLNRRQFSGMFAGIPLFPLIKTGNIEEKEETKTKKLKPSLREQWFDDERIIRQIKIQFKKQYLFYKALSLDEYTGQCTFYHIHTQQCIAGIENKDLDTDDVWKALESFDISVLPIMELINKRSVGLINVRADFKYSITDNKIERLSFNNKELILFWIDLFIRYRV